MTSFSNQVFPAAIFTAAGTSAPIDLSPNKAGANGSYSAGAITVTGVGLSTATLAVMGSSDGGRTYYPLNVSAALTPGTVATSVTITTAGLYYVDLSGITHIEFVTSGTFTAASLSVQLTGSPNGDTGRSGSGGGGGGAVSSVFGRTGAVTAQTGDYSFSQISGTATPAQLPVATTGANGVVRPDGTTITITGGVISAVGGGSGVTSFNTRTGAVVPATNDYSFSQISGTAASGQIPWATPGTIGSTTPSTGAFTTLSSSGQIVDSAAGAVSAPALSLTGAPFTGGTATTTVPLIYANSGATPPSSFSTGGTIFGVNAPSGFVGNFLDFHTNGAAAIFTVNSVGNIVTTGNIVASGGLVVSTSFTGPAGVNTGGYTVGTASTSATISRNQADAVATLVVNNVSASATGNITNFSAAGTVVASVALGGNATFKGISLPVVTKTGAYTAVITDYTILGNATSAAFTVTLPASPVVGQTLVVKKIDSSANTVTVSGNGKNIDGAATYVISAQYTAVMLQYDGTQFWVI